MTVPTSPTGEIAKASGEIAKALAPAIETGSTLFAALLGEPCKEAGGLVADQIKAWRRTNVARAEEKFGRLLQDRGTRPRALPPDFVFPAMIEVANVSDDELQDTWARLLVSAVEDDANHRIAFVHLLKQFSPNEAKVLRAIIETRAYMAADDPDLLASKTGLKPDDVLASIAALQHLGLISVGWIRLSNFAAMFCKSCFGNADVVDRFVEKQPPSDTDKADLEFEKMKAEFRKLPRIVAADL